MRKAKIDWKLAFLIGIIGSIVLKIVEILLGHWYSGQWQWAYATTTVWQYLLLYMLPFIIIISIIVTWGLVKIFKKDSVAMYTPAIYYLIKELYNATVSTGSTWIVILEAIVIGIPVGYAVGWIITKIYNKKR